MSTLPPDRARARVIARPAATPLFWLSALLLAAAFTVLVVWRATPIRLTATAAPVEYQLADGSRLMLEPGASAQVIREFSLWWSDRATPRAVILHRGRGSIDAIADRHPFVIETKDAHLEIADAAVQLDADGPGGTRVTVTRGRVMVTARDIMGAVQRDGDTSRAAASGVLAAVGQTVLASAGTLELMDDVASDAQDAERCATTCSN